MDVGENCYLRTARREWHCFGQYTQHLSPDCTLKIPRGTKYIECVDSVPAFQSGERYCIPCARLQLGSMVDWSLVA